MQGRCAAAAGVPAVRHPMHTGGSQQAVFGAWRTESPTKDGRTTDDIVSNASSYLSSNKKQPLYDAGIKQFKALVQISGQAANMKFEMNVMADGRKKKAARFGKSAYAKSEDKPRSSTLKMACKAAGCNKKCAFSPSAPA